jgi:hypothetical protein
MQPNAISKRDRRDKLKKATLIYFGRQLVLGGLIGDHVRHNIGQWAVIVP